MQGRQQHLQANHSCDDWLEDASIIDKTEATETVGQSCTHTILYNSTDHREQAS